MIGALREFIGANQMMAYLVMMAARLVNRQPSPVAQACTKPRTVTGEASSLANQLVVCLKRVHVSTVEGRAGCHTLYSQISPCSIPSSRFKTTSPSARRALCSYWFVTQTLIPRIVWAASSENDRSTYISL
jgi:hypothetical protein